MDRTELFDRLPRVGFFGTYVYFPGNFFIVATDEIRDLLGGRALSVYRHRIDFQLSIYSRTISYTTVGDESWVVIERR